jgi:glycine cleavage system H protein
MKAFIISLLLIVMLAFGEPSASQDVKVPPVLEPDRPKPAIEQQTQPARVQDAPLQDPVAELREADRYYAEGIYWKAVEIYNKYWDFVQADGYRLYNLGWIYYQAPGLIDYVRSLDYFLKAESYGSGDPTQYIIGMMYYEGKGTAHSILAARIWFERAASLGNSEAMFCLGKIYEEENPSLENFRTALAWYQKASEKGHKQAKEKYTALTETLSAVDLIAADVHFREGDYVSSERLYNEYLYYLSPAQFANLGYIYHHAQGLVNYSRSMEAYHAAAVEGNAEAMFGIGDLLYDGLWYDVQSDPYRFVPEEWRYSKQDLWVRLEGDVMTVGLTNYAQHELGDIVFVKFEKSDAILDCGEGFGSIEAVKTVIDLQLPLSGRIIEYNETLISQPELVNQDPYGKGWLVRMRPSNPGEYFSLMDASAYAGRLTTGPDYKKALEWYTLSAEKGNLNAMKKLYFIYKTGKGADPNPREANRWWNAYTLTTGTKPDWDEKK